MKIKSWVMLMILLASAVHPGLAFKPNQSSAAGSAAASEYVAFDWKPARPGLTEMPDTLVVRGRVVDSGGQGIAGLWVEAVLPGDQPAASARSEAGGRFTIAGLEVGGYRLRVLQDNEAVLQLANPQAALVTEREVHGLAFHELVILGAPEPAVGIPAIDQGPPTRQPGPAPAPAVVASPVTIQASGQITGVITAEDTSLPLGYSYVYASDENQSYIGGAYANSDGLYALTGLDTGNYFLHFNYFYGNYAPEWYNNQPNFAQADPVPVVDGEITPAINAALAVGGQISGTVTASDTSLPLNNVGVYASGEDSEVYSGSTDSGGNYLIEGMPTGMYQLYFSPYGQPDYLGEYYNDKSDPEMADLVSVTQGSLTSGIDASLARGGKIAGLVLADDTGLPLTDISVYVYDQGGDYTGSTSVSASGVYTVTALLSGSYYLYFSPYSYGSAQDYIPEYYNNQYTLDDAEAVTVNVPDTTSGVNISLEHGGKITGHVTAEDTGLPLTDISVSLYDTQGYYVDSTSVSVTGAYTLPQLTSGNYYLYFSPYSSGMAQDYIPEYYNDKYSSENADAVTVVAPDTTSGIDASLVLGGKLSGQVTEESSGDPIDDVWITLYTSAGDYLDSMWPDASGVYTFTGLLSGDYKLRFNPSQSGVHADYIPEYYNDALNWEAADVVEVNAPDTTSGIDAALALGGKITGLVTASDSLLPLENIDVLVYDSNGDVVADTTTDASGQYTVNRLTSGSYHLRFYPVFSAREYISEYYDNQPDLDSADPVVVVAPDITSGIDASLERGGTISGRVTGEDSQAGLPDVYVDVYDCYGWVTRGTTTDASGYYTITGLITGWYTVGYSPQQGGESQAYLDEFYDNAASQESATPVSVQAGETRLGIDAALAHGGQISGRITAADSSAPLDDIYIDLYNDQGNYAGYTWTDANGVYTTTGLPSGDYTLWFGTNQYSASRDYSAEYYNNKPSSETADPVSVTAPEIITGIDAALERGGRISGRVTREDSSTGIEDAWVDTYDPTTDYWASTNVDSQGYYTIYGLPSGDYEVTFTPYGEDAQYLWESYNNKPPAQNPDVVTVTAPDEVSGIDAALAKGGAIECQVNAANTNAPLENVYVVAYDQAGRWAASDWTDSGGKCKLNGLPSGDYRVQFRTTTLYSYKACMITRVQYVEEYYNNQPDLDSADPITVLAPNIVTGIEAQLALGPALPPIGGNKVFLPQVPSE